MNAERKKRNVRAKNLKAKKKKPMRQTASFRQYHSAYWLLVSRSTIHHER